MKTTKTAKFLGLAFLLFSGVGSLACSEGTDPKATGGTGGAAGTGGMGGSAGMASNARCAPGPFVAAGDKPLIDDFNDGDLLIIHPKDGVEDGRSGEFAAADTSAPILENLGTELHFKVTPKATEWPSFGIAIANCYDASKYTGVSFKIKGTAAVAGVAIANPIKFVLTTPPTTPVPEGRCTTGEAMCWDAFGFFIPTLNATDYAEVKILWGQMKQGGWGTAADAGYVPQTEILGLGWGVGKDGGDYDIYLDDVAFMQ